MGIAAQNNYMEIVKFLLAKGAKHDVKCMSRSWNLGKTPLIFAATYGKLDIVKTLITKGADVNAKDLAGNSALMMASKNGHETVTEFLLSKAPTWWTPTCILLPICSPLSSLTPSKGCEGFIVTTILSKVTKLPPPLETK